MYCRRYIDLICCADSSSRGAARGQAAAACSSSPFSGSSTSHPCTATSCASGCPASSAPFRALSYGSLYPCLKELSAPGAHRRGRADPDAWAPHPVARRRSSTSSPPTARSTSSTCSPSPAPRRGTTRASASTSPSSAAPTPTPGMRILVGRRGRLEERLDNLRELVRPHRASVSTTTPRTAEPRPRLRRARSSLAQRADRRRAIASRPAHHQALRRTVSGTRQRSNHGFGTRSHRGRWQLRRRRWSKASSTTRTPTPRRLRPRPDARAVRRLPRQRRRVRRRVRRRRQEGRPRPGARHRRQSENNTIKFADVPPTGITVQRGPTLDGLGKYYLETITESDEAPVDVVAGAAATPGSMSLVCYLPVGSEDAARYYAQCAIDAGVGFVNALPVFIAGTNGVGREVRRRRAADRRRRHQVARSAPRSRTACSPSSSKTAA